MAIVDAVVQQCAHQAVTVLSRHTTVVAAYLFGSRVEGTPHEYSDVDLAVFVEGTDDWDLFKYADVDIAVHDEAGLDVEVHYFRASALPRPRPGSFAAYVIDHGVPIPVDTDA